MFGLRSSELFIILGIALLIFGPKHLPGLGKAIGSAIRGLKRGMSEDAASEDGKPQQGA